MLDIDKLNDKLVSELREIAQNLGIADADTLRKQELINQILKNPQQEGRSAEEISEANESLAVSAQKSRKRTRTTKSKGNEDSPVDDTNTLFNLPEQEEFPEEVKEAVEVLAETPPAAPNPQPTPTPPAEPAVREQAPQPQERKKFDRRDNNQNRDNQNNKNQNQRNQEPAINLDFDNVIVNEGILEIMP